MNAFLKAAIGCLMLLSSLDGAEISKLPLPPRLQAEFQALFQRYYPKATIRTNDFEVVFDFDTQLFQVPRVGKAAGLPPLEQRGPKRAGVLCDIRFVSKPYDGALSVYRGGTTVEFPGFNKFKGLVMAEPAVKQAGHLYLHLYYPPSTDRKFLEDFKRLAMGFEKYVD